MQKTRLADPSFLFDQLGLHDRDLAGRSAERNEPELEPEAESFSEGRIGFPLRIPIGGGTACVRTALTHRAVLSLLADHIWHRYFATKASPTIPVALS